MRFVAILVPLVAGCILAVSPETYGDRCRFAGEETQCGACVIARCGAQTNATCGDDAAMAALESCIARHDGSCEDLRAGASPLAACVATSCSAVCTRQSGTPRTTCIEPPFAAGATCTCEVEKGAPNDFVCAPDAYPETVCCAPKGWPAAGLQCTCAVLGCSPNAQGCFCALKNFGPDRRVCGGASCCAHEDTCTCAMRACQTFERPVPSCSFAEVGCQDGQIRVESCSIRSP